MRALSVVPITACSRTSSRRTEILVRPEIVLYACKIKETANGSRCCTGGEAWQTFEVVTQRRIAPHGEVNERSRAPQNGQDEAQGETDKEEETLKLAKGLRIRAMVIPFA